MILTVKGPLVSDKLVSNSVLPSIQAWDKQKAHSLKSNLNKAFTICLIKEPGWKCQTGKPAGPKNLTLVACIL